MHPSPLMSYRPTPGLVALFANTAFRREINPRAPHTFLRTHAAISYADVARRPMDNGGNNNAMNNQRGGNSGGRGSGQGGFVGPRGFQANANQGFHPGYDSRGTYIGRGGGRYTRGRAGGRPVGGRAPSRGGIGGRRGWGPQAADNRIEEVLPPRPTPAPAPVPALAVGGLNAAANVSFNLPGQVAALLQQAFASLQGANPIPQLEAATIVEDKKGKSIAQLIPIKGMSKATAFGEKPEPSSKAETKEGGGKSPYCYRCLTKGHIMTECTVEEFCEVCASKDHVKARCQIYRADRIQAAPCGYAVQGLGFFHIPHTPGQKQRNDSRSAVVRVTNGVLTVANVVAELERLIPGN